MESKAKSSVSNQVYRQFPEVKGSPPTVKSMPGDKYQLIFHGKATTADGKTISRTIRVIADNDGHVLKLSTSR
jgi:hypothetical protein